MDIVNAFLVLKLSLADHFAAMTADKAPLFELDADKEELWKIYLENAPEKGKIFRKREIHDCSECRHFFRVMGNTAVIRNSRVQTIWDFDPGCEEYRPVVKALADYLKKFPVKGVFVRKIPSVNADKNKELLANGTVLTWEHLYVKIPDHLVDTTNRSEDQIRGEFRTQRDAFQSSLQQISVTAVETVLTLIAGNLLYRGVQWKKTLEEFLELKRTYEAQSRETRDNFVWEHTAEAGVFVCKLKNECIGDPLLTDISKGTDLEKAVARYERLVSGDNYQNSKGSYDEHQLMNARKELTEKAI